MDNQKHRKPTTSKLKRILQCKSNVSPLPSLEKDLDHTTAKAPSSLQQSTNIHSFEINHRSTGKTPASSLHQPISPLSCTSTKKKAKQSQSISTSKSSTRSPSACATKQSQSSTTMASPTGVSGSTTTHGRRSSSLHYNNHSGRNQPATSTLPPLPLPSKSLKKARTNGPTTPHDKINATPKTTIPGATKESSRRRHSCASTTQNQQRDQRSRMLQDAKKTLVPSNAKKSTKATSFNAVTPSCSVLFSKASPAANAALAASPLQQQSYRRQCPPPMLSMEKSRSTPLRSKVKTYNVSPTTPKSPTPQKSTSSSLASPNKRRSQRPDALRLEQDSERIRRQRELEDLISGRRGSTLKLSLTPKNILLN